MKKKITFAVFGNEYQTRKSTSAQKLFSILSERKAEVYVEKIFYKFLTEGQRLSVPCAGTFSVLDFDVDFVISMGGDGTLLKAASKVGNRNVPSIGINMGRLGYLADVLPTEIDKAVSMLYSGNYITESHAVIEVATEGKDFSGSHYALNDIAILKQDNASMITIRAKFDGQNLVTYQADGLIISTPTGSTAYSLSNGGPIIMPQTGVLCLTPVAPHSLNIRPLVVPMSSEITLDVESRSHTYLVAVDGRSEKLPETTRLNIRKASYEVLIVKRRRHNYVATLREKMMWGMDIRE